MIATRITILVSLLFLVPITILGQEGTLLLKQGQVKVIHNGDSHLYNTYDVEIPVYEGDKIHTDKETRAVLYMRENSEEIMLYSKTFFAVSKVEKELSLVSLWVGKAKFLVKPVVELVSGERYRRAFKVRTVRSTIGVKGTEFIVSSGKDTVLLLTMSGIVGMSSRYYPGEEVDVVKGQVSKVEGSARPWTPVDISEEKIDRIFNADTDEPWFDDGENIFPERATGSTETNINNNVGQLVDDMEDLLEDVQINNLESGVKLKVNY